MKYQLPALEYDFGALEPHIDAKTMEIHYTKHHQTYLTKLMEVEGFDPTIPIEELLVKDMRPAVQNQGGGFYNHSLFWKMMTPGGKPLKGALLSAIEAKWGSFEEFQKVFTNAALGQFGSGWAWLVKAKKGGALEILQKANQNHPDIDRVIPILGVDVWEHAYYLKYQNRRPDYVKAWWSVVNWEFCQKQFSN